jgi:tRNA-guanine family transglycosylase
VDTFDSAFPTRNGRHGCLFAEGEQIKIGNSKWATHFEPVSPYLPYTGAYLHHLFKVSLSLSFSAVLRLFQGSFKTLAGLFLRAY